MTPEEMPEVAKRLGFINVDAMENWKRKRETVTLDGLLVDLCNLQQMVLITKCQVEEVSDRLTATGTERIG